MLQTRYSTNSRMSFVGTYVLVLIPELWAYLNFICVV